MARELGLINTQTAASGPPLLRSGNRAFRRLFVALLLLFILLSGCSNNDFGYVWGWYSVSPGTPVGRQNLSFLIGGLIPTLSVSFISLGISVALGLIIALVGMIPTKVARAFNRGYVEIFRSVPVLVMLLWTYYGLPISLGINLDIFPAAVLALALCDSAFEAEIFRGGIQAVTRSQREAAHSLGLSTWQTMRHVVLPQAIRKILPPLGNQFVYMLKMSSLVSVIGLGELTRRANELTVIEYRPLEIYTVLIIEYLIIILTASYLVRRLERKLTEGIYE